MAKATKSKATKPKATKAKARAKPAKKSPPKKPANKLATKPATKPATKLATKLGKSASKLQLQVESGKLIKGVTAAQLRKAITGEKFAILGGGSRSGTYIQTAEQDEAPFRYILEYQDGSLSEHFEAVHQGIELDAIIAAFTKYLAGDASWRDDFTWKRMKL
jgi:hypothetical protein